MADIQDSILRLNFNQMLPKSINDKIQSYQEQNKEGKFNKGGKQLGKKGEHDKTKDIIHDNDKNHSHWHLKENENFAQTFYKNQKECPQSSDGKQICMKFFLRGIFTKSCPRAHNFMKEDEKQFKQFLLRCREGASKPDFQIGVSMPRFPLCHPSSLTTSIGNQKLMPLSHALSMKTKKQKHTLTD